MIVCEQVFTIRQLMDVADIRKKAFGHEFKDGASYIDDGDVFGDVFLLFDNQIVPVFEFNIGTVRLKVDNEKNACVMEMLAITESKVTALLRVIRLVSDYCHDNNLEYIYATPNCSNKRMWERVGAKLVKTIHLDKYGVDACLMEAKVEDIDEYLEFVGRG